MKPDWKFGDVLYPAPGIGFQARIAMYIGPANGLAGSFKGMILRHDPEDFHAMKGVGVGAVGAIYDAWSRDAWHRSYD